MLFEQLRKYKFKRADQVIYEIVNLIVAQRAYEMNSKVRGEADQMMQTINNIR